MLQHVRQKRTEISACGSSHRAHARMSQIATAALSDIKDLDSGGGGAGRAAAGQPPGAGRYGGPLGSRQGAGGGAGGRPGGGGGPAAGGAAGPAVRAGGRGPPGGAAVAQSGMSPSAAQTMNLLEKASIRCQTCSFLVRIVFYHIVSARSHGQ